MKWFQQFGETDLRYFRYSLTITITLTKRVINCQTVLNTLTVVRVVLVVYDESYMKFLVKCFLCVGNLGFTRPIQDYGSGPGTPLAHK